MERTHVFNSTSFQICLTLFNQNFEWWKILVRFVKLFCSIWTFEYVFVSSFLCCYIANTLALSYPYSHQMKINVRSITCGVRLVWCLHFKLTCAAFTFPHGHWLSVKDQTLFIIVIMLTFRIRLLFIKPYNYWRRSRSLSRGTSCS